MTTLFCYSCNLDRYHPVNARCAEDAELALVITTEVNMPAAAFASTGQRHLVNRSHALLVFILKHHNRLTRYRRGQAEIRKLYDLAADRWLRSGNGGFGLWVHFTIEAEEMYPLK